MIIHLKSSVSEPQAQALAKETNSICLFTDSGARLVTSSSIKTLPDHLTPHVAEFFVFPSDIQLASMDYQPKQAVSFGELSIGSGDTTLMIAGPCAVESRDQIGLAATFLKNLGVKVLRAGCFKPRTSPYTFQGLGEEGLKLLAEVREKTGLKIITEVKDHTHFDLVADYTDVIQIGAKAMYDTSILRSCGQSKKPVLLKRGFGSTLQELVQSAEFILSAGNPNVILCERGIRTFETKTRFTLDLCGVAYLKQHINLPVVVDPSHAMGYRYGVADLTRAAVAMGVDGLIIETHPNPQNAKSDAAQQLSFSDFETLYYSLEPVAKAVGKKLI